jgi:hypothetical protein
MGNFQKKSEKEIKNNDKKKRSFWKASFWKGGEITIIFEE